MAYRRIILSALVVLLYAPSARGSGGGISNVGGVTTGATGASGVRQWVSLTRTGSVLVGKVNESVVNSIEITASGVESSNVILREIAFPDGGTSVLVSGPTDLQAALQQVRLYVWGDPAETRLLEYRDGRWRAYSASIASFDSGQDSGHGAALLEFCVPRLGQYHLAATPMHSGSSFPSVLPVVTAHGLVGGGVLYGMWHLGWAVLLLVIASAASHWAHAVQTRRFG